MCKAKEEIMEGLGKMCQRDSQRGGVISEQSGRTRRKLGIVGLLLIFAAVGESHVRINEQGGYEDVVVSISKEVPPIACQQLIQNIQVC